MYDHGYKHGWGHTDSPKAMPPHHSNSDGGKIEVGNVYRLCN